MLAPVTNRPRRRTLRVALGAILAGTMLALGALSASPAAAQQSYLRVTDHAFGATQTVRVAADKSMILDLPADVSEVIVASPSTAITIMRSKRRAIIQGGAPGSTNIFFLDGVGRTISVVDVTVVGGGSLALADTFSRVLPGSRVNVESYGDRVVLSGTVRSGEELAQATAIAAQFAGGVENVANLLTVIGNQQVMLKVTVAEVRREAVKQFGINLTANFNVGSLSTGIVSAPAPSAGGVSGVSNPNSLSVGVDIGNLSIDALVRALERRNALRTLAEPTLVAMSGQPAEFLAGGQLPYQTVVDGRINTEFKDFGVQLAFTPVVKANGSIMLQVQTSVSEPTQGGAIAERRASTTVELPPGCTLAIGGMIQDSMRQQIDKWPWLGDVPIIGALFRNRDFVRQQTELMILVTPYFAETGRPVLPTDNFVPASDAETIFLGQMEKLYGVGNGGMRGGFDGSVGFVLD